MKILLHQPYSFHQLGRRANQEDARFPDTDRPSAAAQPFFAVCDGVGGAEGGELASSAVCSSLGKFMDDQDPALPFALEDFQEALECAYRSLYETMSQAQNFDMATTLTFLYFSSVGVSMAHMGDSRIYQFRQGKGMIYRSDDHSLVNEMVRNGEIAPEEAESHSLRNCITRCMNFIPDGAEMPCAEMRMTRDVLPGDCFFLCTDGVLHGISDSDLEQLLCFEPGTDEEKMEMIAHEASTSTDNNTALLVRVKDVELEAYEADPELSDSQKADIALSKLGKDGKCMTIEYGITSVRPRAPQKSVSERISSFFRK